MIGYATQQLLNRTFYALQDTWTPVTVGVISIIINVVLNFALIGPMGHGGLALAYSVAGLFMMVALLYLLRRKIGSFDGRALLISFTRSLLASVIMGLVVYFTAVYLESVLDMTSKLNQIIQAVTGIGLGVGVYGTFALAFRSEEALLAWNIFSRRFHRKPSKPSVS
jgi:putative peptidoglycan lipid II flippase